MRGLLQDSAAQKALVAYYNHYGGLPNLEQGISWTPGPCAFKKAARNAVALTPGVAGRPNCPIDYQQTSLIEIGSSGASHRAPLPRDLFSGNPPTGIASGGTVDNNPAIFMQVFHWRGRLLPPWRWLQHHDDGSRRIRLAFAATS